MRSHLITVPLTLLAIGFVACGTNPANDNQGPYDADTGLDTGIDTDVDTGIDTGLDTGLDTDTTTDPVIDTDIDPIIDVSAQVWCQPTATSYDIANIPALPEGFEAARFCAVDAMPLPDDVSASFIWQYDPTLRVLDVSGGNFAARQSHTFTLDEDGNAREIRAYGTTGFYSAGYGETWYTLDADGEMLHKVAVSMPFEDAEEDTWVVVEQEQTWVNGVLTRFTQRDGEDGPLVRETTWQYDDNGQLIVATATDRTNPDATRVDEAVWTYHDDGQPASVERSIGGIIVERETWTFNDNELVSRTYHAISSEELVAQLTDLPGDPAIGWQFSAPLDSYQYVRHQSFNEDPWLGAVPVVSEDGNCATLPRGPGHGYPQAEQQHLLGVTIDERPTGIGFAYGNDQYGWYYGDLGWYGHNGSGTAWLGTDGIFNTSLNTVDAEVHYEDGVMVRESGSATDSGEAFSYERGRTMGSTGFIVDDWVRIESGDESAERTMVFVRDRAGNITRRSLLNSEQELIESQTNTYDEAGRVIAHAIEPATIPGDPDQDPTGGFFIGFGSYTEVAAEWTWAYEDGLVVERSGPDSTQTLTYDDRGNEIAREGTFVPLDSYGFVTRTYNDADQVTETCLSSDGVGYACNRIVYDAAGRVAWYENNYGTEVFQVTSAYDYACSE